MGFSEYVLSIAGIILISIVIDLVICDGALSSHIKSIFSFFTIAVIIAPLPSFLSIENISSVLEIGDYEIQKGYIYTLNESRLETMAKEEELLLQAEGYKNINIIFSSSNMTESELRIDGVNINIVNLVIQQGAEYHDKIELKNYLTDKICQKYSIEEGGVVYEE